MARLTIEYYKINYHLNNQLSLLRPNNEKDILDNLWNDISKTANKYKDNPEYEYYVIENSDKFIEFIEITDDYIFGILGKADEVSKGILKRIKSKEEKEVSGLFLEKYNYFYLKKKNLSISVIRNSQSPSFKNPFNKFINLAKTESFKTLNVIKVIDKNIDSKIGKIRSLLNINMIFDSESNIGWELLSFNNIFHLSNNNLIKANVNLKLKNEVVTEDLVELMKNEETIKSDFEKFEVIANTEEGEQTIELVERWLIKSIEIELEDDDLMKDNLHKIKEALEQSFIN